MARQQVSPLGPPDRLQPSGIQSDTFAAPAPPPIDNNGERLAQALGGFSQTLNEVYRFRLAADKKKETENQKQFLENAEKEFLLWRNQQTDTTALEAYRMGHAPYQADKYFSAYVERRWGQEEAKRFAGLVQQELHTNPEITAGKDWNPDRFLMERMNEFTKDGRLNFSVHSVKSFSEGLDSVRGELVNWTAKQNQERAALAGRTAAFGTLGEQLSAGLDANLTGQALMDHVRARYKELGPRIKGGALDLRNHEIDSILLDVLEQRAKEDPRVALVLNDLVKAERVDPTTGEKIAPLGANPNLLDKIQGVRTTAAKTLNEHQSKAIEQMATANAVKAFVARNGSFGALQQDIELPNGKTLKADKVKEMASQAVLQQLRAKNDGKVNLAEELEYFQRNDVAHPVMESINGEAIAALTAIQSKSGDPNAVARFVQSANLYREAASGNMPYTERHLKGDTKEIYETYTVLVDYLKVPPEAAALQALTIFSDAKASKYARADMQHKQEVDTALQKIDLNGWGFGGSTNSWFGPAINNAGTLRNRLIDVATTLMRVQGIGAEDAIKRAAERIEAQAAFVNGQALFGVRGINKGDEPYVQEILKRTFEENKETFKRNDVTDPSKVSVMATPNGTMFLINSETGKPIINHKPVDGKPSFFPLFPQKVQEARSKFEEADKQYKVNKTLEINEKVREGQVNPSAPHNLLRGLFGYDPVPGGGK